MGSREDRRWAQMGSCAMRKRLRGFYLVDAKNPGNHAKQIRKAADKCPHRGAEEEDHNV